MTRKSMLALAALATALLGNATAAVAQANGDATRGRHVFRKCTVCHVVNPSSTALLAPPLSNIIGRTAATIPGFEYSDIMKIAGQRGLVWTKDALYHFLDRPEQFIPGTYMAFAGLEPQERADVIAYLETIHNKSDNPQPKPNPQETQNEQGKQAEAGANSGAPRSASNGARENGDAQPRPRRKRE